MCNVSMIFDTYKPYIPTQWTPTPTVVQPYTAEELRELIESFKQAVEAAKSFDRLTGQPDCEDPEKAQLIERVAELEAKLDEIARSALEGKRES